MLNKTIYPSFAKQLKDKEANSKHFNKSIDVHGFNVTKNFRVKTEDFHQRPYNVRVNSKRLSTINTETTGMYHPDVYHRPEVRKKYFCQLVDSYFNNKKVFEEKVCIRKDKIMQNSTWSRRNNIHKTIQTAFEQQKNNKSLDDKKSNKKRASTAGYTRKKEQPNNSRLLNEKNLDETINNYLNEEELDQIKRKCSGNAQVKFNSYLKNKINNKLAVLNNFLKSSHKNIKKPKDKSQNTTPFGKCFKNDPGIDSLGSSIVNESQGHCQQISQIPLYTNEKLFQSKTKIKKNLEKKAHQSRYKQTLVTVNSSFQDSKSRLKSNSSRQSIFSVKNNIKIESEIKEEQKTKMQKQINSRLKIINPEYGQLKWKVDRVHNYKLYKICDISGCDQTKYNFQNKRSVSLQKNDSFGSVFGKKKKQLIHLRIKIFQEDSVAENIKNTIQKAYQFGVSHLWKQVPKDPLLQNNEQYHLFYSASKKSLRQQLFKFTELQKSKEQKFPIYKIQVTSVFHQLFHNNCEYFNDIIRSVALDLVKMNGKIINNKISLDNLYRLEEKSIKIGDWGSSAVCRTIKVNGSDIIFRDVPILKYEENENDETQQKNQSSWLLHPQNLAPQIIECLMEQNYSKIWEKQHCPQIWNLGILIFQILTWIPVWIPYQTQVLHKVPKYGYLYDSYQRLSQIYSLQCKIPAIVSRLVRDQKNSPIFKQINPEIVSLMKSMLQLNINLRPKPQQVLKKLQTT